MNSNTKALRRFISHLHLYQFRYLFLLCLVALLAFATTYWLIPSTENPHSIITPSVTAKSTPPEREGQVAPQDNLLTRTEDNISPPWHKVIVKSGDNLSLIFKKNKLSQQQLAEILKLGKAVKPLKNLKPGQVLSFQIDENGQLQALRYNPQINETLLISQAPTGFKAEQKKEPLTHRLVQTEGTVHHSLYVAGVKAGLSDVLIMEFANIFAWDIDLAREVQKGDQFKLIYDAYYYDGKWIKNGDILAAELDHDGKDIEAIRYTDQKGRTSYYTPKGYNLQKAFLRTPLHYQRISSLFNPHRKHPILNRIRAHQGVDYAAPRGTPIKAAGDGRIIFRGRKGGYGNTIILSHGNRYTTLYGHMQRFSKKFHRGSYVKQGQIIGYVGSTGLATGPHLHYEFRINGKHYDPLKVKLPQAKPIPISERERFQKQAQKMLALLKNDKYKVLS